MSKTNRTRTKTASTNKERHRQTHNFNYLNEPGDNFSLLTVEESEHKKKKLVRDQYFAAKPKYAYKDGCKCLRRFLEVLK